MATCHGSLIDAGASLLGLKVKLNASALALWAKSIEDKRQKLKDRSIATLAHSSRATHPPFWSENNNGQQWTPTDNLTMTSKKWEKESNVRQSTAKNDQCDSTNIALHRFPKDPDK